MALLQHTSYFFTDLSKKSGDELGVEEEGTKCPFLMVLG
jgi:hypothetical protein